MGFLLGVIAAVRRRQSPDMNDAQLFRGKMDDYRRVRTVSGREPLPRGDGNAGRGARALRVALPAVRDTALTVRADVTTICTDAV